MAKEPHEARLAQYGLSVDQIMRASATPNQDGAADRNRFSILMMNYVQLSTAADPGTPVAKGRMELIRVEIAANLMTIADIWGEKSLAGQLTEQVGARLYARRAVGLDGATAFTFLEQLPDGIEDEKFFPAYGTAILLEDERSGAHILKASGTDANTGARQGWIFQAIET